MNDFINTFSEISELLQNGKAKEIVSAIEKALSEGVAPADILEKGLLTGMAIIGRKFKRERIFVPEVLIASRAMNYAITTLKPVLINSGLGLFGKVVICTVKGDLHDIGKNLVKMMIESRGIEVLDLGVDCPCEKIVNAIRNSNAKVLCLSALITTTMLGQKDAINALKTAGLRDKVKVMVGGAPITQRFADEIGADVYAPDATKAAEICRGFFLKGH